MAAAESEMTVEVAEHTHFNGIPWWSARVLAGGKMEAECSHQHLRQRVAEGCAQRLRKAMVRGDSRPFTGSRQYAWRKA